MVFHEIGRSRAHNNSATALESTSSGKHFELFFGHLSAFGDDGGILLNGYTNGFPANGEGSIPREV